jgi:hypothetical protein
MTLKFMLLCPFVLAKGVLQMLHIIIIIIKVSENFASAVS